MAAGTISEHGCRRCDLTPAGADEQGRRPDPIRRAGARAVHRGRPPRRHRRARDPIGRPGAYPYTRGVYESMYRGRLWTMRQFAGFGTSEETNERFHYLLDHGQTGLSTAFDMPSLMGHDSDHARSLGEVGREGVAVDTLDDMQTLFAGIDLGEVSRVDDHQRARRDHARLLRRRRRARRRRRPGGAVARPSACRARSRRTSSRSTSPRRSGAFRSTPRCACAGT